MAVGISIPGQNGEETKISFNDSKDTNLMLGFRKSPFTVIRSFFTDDNGNTQYEFWVKAPNKSKGMVVDGAWYSGGNYYVDGIYPTRPSTRPRKLVFDSRRTAIADFFDANYSPKHLNNIVGNWTYIGSSEGSEDKDFDLYGIVNRDKVTFFEEVEDYYDENAEVQYYKLDDGTVVSDESLIQVYDKSDEQRILGLLRSHESGTYLNPYWIEDPDEYYDVVPSYFSQYPALTKSEWDSLRGYVLGGWVGTWSPAAIRWDNENTFSRKIAEIRDWEIVSNDTPTRNTYYVVVENKKGEVLDVKTTTEFGVTVGSLIGSYSDKFSESVLNQRVVDDLVIKMK